MASACVNNMGVSPESFQPTTSYSSYSWLSPRISFSREDESSKPRSNSLIDPSSADLVHGSDPTEIQDAAAGGFEFRLEDSVTMLPADELFSDGKLVPLHFSTLKQDPPVNALSEIIKSPETAKSCEMEISGTDHYLFSPKAPRCSTRWRELLGLKKFSQTTSQPSKSQSQSKMSLLSNNNPKFLKHFPSGSSKSSSSNFTATWADSSLSLPLLKDPDYESVSISTSRLSLSSSSSSSGHEHEDLPRLSLDSDKPSLNNPSPNPFAPCRNLNPNPNPTRMRIVKPRPGSGSDTNQIVAAGAWSDSSGVTSRGVSVDSPRMNSSGKIVFQSLERSSSSPSSFNGGPRFKQRGLMERSYSANVRITPVLNVPVYSLRGSSSKSSSSVFGFGQLFSSSPQKSANGGSNKGSTCRNKTTDRNH